MDLPRYVGTLGIIHISTMYYVVVVCRLVSAKRQPKVIVQVLPSGQCDQNENAM